MNYTRAAGAEQTYLADCSQKKDEVIGLGLIGRILPVNVESLTMLDKSELRQAIAKLTIEAEVLNQLDCGGGKGLTASICGHGSREIGGVSPASNGEKNFHVAVFLLEEIQLFYTAIDIRSDVVP